jgi:glycine/D-amino acid oxidase-like deaminating enzyme
MAAKEFGIVGWGLAGATLAWQLYFEKKEFLVFDSNKNYSTRAAAGMVNPIVFRRLTKSWNADLLMPYAADFYKRIEAVLGQSVVDAKNVYKLFSSFEDENNWMVKQQDDRFSHFLQPLSQNEKIENVKNEFGYGVVNTFGNLRTNDFLDLSKAFFKANSVEFIDEIFNYETLNLENNTNGATQCEHLIFCEGFDVLKSPLFGYLPLRPTHGDTLIIKSDNFKFKHILNKNMFILHVKDNLFKVGATYNWKITEPIKTEEGKNELIEKLNKFAEFDYEVVEHQAGIRPTVMDRRPLIGTHPNYPKIHIFNGLGTKGVMIAPFYSNTLIQNLINGQVLDKETNITRYTKFLA